VKRKIDMPCQDAMITEVVTSNSEATVADIMDLYEEHRIRAVPIVDKNNKLLGLCSLKHLLHAMLPATVDTIETERVHRVQIEYKLDAFLNTSHYITSRLGDLMNKKVSEVMIDPDVVKGDTPLREGMRLLALHGSPIPVIDDKNTLIGLISSQTAIRRLMELKKELDSGKVSDE